MTKPVSKAGERAIAIVMVAIGLWLNSVALGWLHLPPEDVHAPMWVLAACGFVFALGGIMVLARHHQTANALLATFLCLAFAAIGAWIALFAPIDEISGGLPFLSHETNGRIGKGMFGLGALVSLFIAWVAWRDFLTRRQKLQGDEQ